MLYSFCPGGGDICSDGNGPERGVTFDRSGNLYGTTAGGGNAFLAGVLYKLTPSSGGWTETVLYNFPVRKNWRNDPGPVTIDPHGRLYTTLTSFFTNYSNGVVARLNTNGSIELFRFNGTDGRGPSSGVVVDTSRGVLYGTTDSSLFGPGNVFQIDTSDQESVLYTFCQQSDCTDGDVPGGLVEDKLGNLYGTTGNGGNQGEGYGVVFEITP
ncbi:MAG TPA: choice-of-anchor tandem repeat GloVer-containing protein [Candidatus Dormibacteraeota bacterium]|nr:choice-of-anchor tandem repeat GloVer-containing protein [Candidatus Dormibacteraeota bacterium]